jgi:hypothetical protein
MSGSGFTRFQMVDPRYVHTLYYFGPQYSMREWGVVGGRVGGMIEAGNHGGENKGEVYNSTSWERDGKKEVLLNEGQHVASVTIVRRIGTPRESSWWPQSQAG